METPLHLPTDKAKIVPRALGSSMLLYMALRHGTWPSVIEIDSMNCLRRLDNVKWYHHVRNSTIRQQTKQHPVSITLTQRRLRWFGHLQRMLKCWNCITSPEHNRLDATKGPPSTTTVVWLRISRHRSHRPPPRWGSSYRQSSHHLHGVPFFVVWPLRWMTSKSKSSYTISLCGIDHARDIT